MKQQVMVILLHQLLAQIVRLWSWVCRSMGITIRQSV